MPSASTSQHITLRQPTRAPLYRLNREAAARTLLADGERTLSALLASSPPCLTNNLSGAAAVLCERREAGVSDQTLAVRDQCEEPDRSNWLASRLPQRLPRCAGDSSGNTVGKYWALRALAAFSGARVLILRACPAPFNEMDFPENWLPEVVPPGALERMQSPSRQHFRALCTKMQHPSRARMLDEGLWMQRDWWYPFLPQLAHELRAAVSAYTRRRRRPDCSWMTLWSTCDSATR